MIENRIINTIKINQTKRVNLTDRTIDTLNPLEITNNFDNISCSPQLTSYLKIQNLLSYWGINKSIIELKTIFKDDNELLNKFIELLTTLKDEIVLDKVKEAIQKSEIKVQDEKGSFTKSKEFPNFKTFAKRLIIDLLKVLENPNVISQERKATCGQTSIERSIVEDNKNQYIDILLQFLMRGYYQKNQNSPKIELNTGGIINNPDIEGNDERLLTTRIITPSFANYSFQQMCNCTYNDDLDISEEIGIRGSNPKPTLEAVTGKEYTENIIENLDNLEKLSILKKALEESKQYPVLIAVIYNYNTGTIHGVRLLDIDENKIVVSNPWGQIETFTKGKEVEIVRPENNELATSIKMSLRDIDYEKYLNGIKVIMAPILSENLINKSS